MEKCGRGLAGTRGAGRVVRPCRKLPQESNRRDVTRRLQSVNRDVRVWGLTPSKVPFCKQKMALYCTRDGPKTLLLLERLRLPDVRLVSAPPLGQCPACLNLLQAAEPTMSDGRYIFLDPALTSHNEHETTYKRCPSSKSEAKTEVTHLRRGNQVRASTDSDGKI